MNEIRPVLIIEDDEDAAEIFAEALAEAGFTPEIVNDGKQALARLHIVRPVIVTLDLHLPSVSGQAILQRIRSDAQLADIKIIVTTADSLMADSLRHDADLVLLKPIGYAQLRDLSSRLVKW